MISGRFGPPCRRRGFALLAVLWTLMGAMALALSLSLTARESVATARNRKEYIRALWQAAGCVEQTRLVIDGALRSAATARDAAPLPWRSLDTRVAASPMLASTRCNVAVEAVGRTANINVIDAETLGAVLTAAGFVSPRRDSLVDALLDWRDADDVAREHGAERGWYAATHRPAPRNGPLADMNEIRLVRGFEQLPTTSALLGVEPGRIALTHASPALLAALPGLSAEAARLIVDARMRGEDLDNVLMLSGRMSRAARDLLQSRYADLTRLTSAEPEGWIVTARARAARSSVTAEVEIKVVRAGPRAAVVRRRTRWR